MENSPAALPATSPTSSASTSPWTPRVAWAAPPVLAAVVLLHRNDPVDAMDLSGATTTWIWIHVVLLGALTLLAHAIRILLADADGYAATVARGLLPIALVTYAAFDALVGLGTGVLVERAETLGPDAAQLVEHWWSVPTPISGIAAIAQLSWVTVLGATAIARSTRNAPCFLVPVLVALAGTLPLLHVRPFGLRCQVPGARCVDVFAAAPVARIPSRQRMRDLARVRSSGPDSTVAPDDGPLQRGVGAADVVGEGECHGGHISTAGSDRKGRSHLRRYDCRGELRVGTATRGNVQRQGLGRRARCPASGGS